MRWAWKVGRVAGIEIRIHATFLLLLVWVGLAHVLEGRNGLAAGLEILFLLAVFFVIVLHELGHALTARRFGVRTFDITLLPIGGIARLERIPEQPRQEFLIAIAGPAVNLALAAILFLLLGPLPTGPEMLPRLETPAGFFARLAFVNLGLAFFNLLPAFPMDGGRAFRALLSTRMSHVAATQIAARLGQGLAFLLAALGILLNPFLLFIGLFIWITASEEASASRLKAGIEGIPVHQAMVTEFHSLAPEDPLGLAVNYLLHGRQQDFPVCREGRILGLLTHKGLLEALARKGESVPVALAMEARFESIGPDDPLAEALPKLHAAGPHTLPVVRNQQVLGLLTFESFAELWMIQAALRQGKP